MRLRICYLQKRDQNRFLSPSQSLATAFSSRNTCRNPEMEWIGLIYSSVLPQVIHAGTRAALVMEGFLAADGERRNQTRGKDTHG